jgi:hypothetical protein
MRKQITISPWLASAVALAAGAQGPSALGAPELVWYSIDGAAVSLAGGPYTLVATAGQPDAGVTLSGGTLRLGGGGSAPSASRPADRRTSPRRASSPSPTAS